MFKRIFILFVVLTLFVPLTRRLNACSVCGCGDPLQSAGTVHSMAGDFHLGLETLYLTASAQSDDNPAQTESLTQKTLSGILSFSPTDNLTMVAMVPYTEKDWTLSAASDGSEEGAAASPAGLGDINFGLRYFLLVDMDFKNRGSQNIAVSAGTLIPTGNEDGLDSSGVRFDQHAQLGTGAWGPYVGLLYTGIVNGWTFSTNLNVLFHTVNSYQYHFGTAFTWGAQAQAHLDDSFALSLAAEGRTAGEDISEEESQSNTGGTVLDLTPGLWWSPVEAWGLYGKIQVPLLTHLDGNQTVGATANVGTQILLR